MIKHKFFFPNFKLKQISKSNLTDGGGEEDSWNRQLVKPDDQLELTEAELNEEVPKVLSSDNTNVSRNLVIYSFKEGGFVLVFRFELFFLQSISTYYGTLNSFRHRRIPSFCSSSKVLLCTLTPKRPRSKFWKWDRVFISSPTIFFNL